MFSTSFFSCMHQGQSGTSQEAATTSSAIITAAAAPSPVLSDSTKGAETFSYGYDVHTTVDAETHVPLPKQPLKASGSANSPLGTSGNNNDRPNILKEWCDIFYHFCCDVVHVSYRKVRSTTAAGLGKNPFEDEAWDFFADHPSHHGEEFPTGKFNQYYSSLPTTRTCAWVLPGVHNAPLVLHIAVFFVSLEALQATLFYVRYRCALRKTEAAFAEATEIEEREDEDAAANAEKEPQEGASVLGGCTVEDSVMPFRSASELSASCAARARLPQGSSRALHRLCSYWVLIEKAVRQAPLKDAGLPTTVAQPGRFFGSAHVGEDGGTNHGAQRKNINNTASHDEKRRVTNDGAPYDAGKVLVLSDERAFPVIRRGHHRIESTASSSMAATPATNIMHEIEPPWQVFHCLWTDTVRYSVNYTEIRQLLLGCNVAEIQKLFEENSTRSSGTGSRYGLRRVWLTMTRSCRQPSLETVPNGSDVQLDSSLRTSATVSFSSHGVANPTSQQSSSPLPRYIDSRVCVVCMALTWYLSLIREVYEAVVVHQDVHRCSEALNELHEYQRAVYQRGVEVGAEFFEEVLRHSQAHSNEPSVNNRAWHSTRNNNDRLCDRERKRRGSDVSPQRLLLPQVNSSGAVATHDARAQPSTIVVPTHLLARNTHDGTPQQQQSGPSSSTPLVFDFPDSSTQPLPPYDDRNHCNVLLRAASPRACWAELTAALATLLRRRRLMELACVRSLFCYLYAGSAAKIVSFIILALLTSLSSRISALGQATRESISNNLDTYYRTTAQGNEFSRGGSDSSRDNEATPVGTRILALFAFECTRLAVHTVMTKTTSEYITLSASQRRNTVKAELYEALTHMPLAFFDLHSYDEVEQIVYYVNDIEGVEVHVHNYVCSLVTSLVAMQHAVRQLPFRARLLVGVTVAASLGVKYVGQKMKCWTQAEQRTGGVFPPWFRGRGLDGTVSATAELDAQVEENMESDARQGGAMLRGLDIVAVLPQLRPYAADLSLMRWWTNHTRMCGAEAGATEATTLAEGLMVLLRQLYGKTLPALGGAIIAFADWVLPTVVSSYGASIAFSGLDALSLSNRLIEAMHCVNDTVSTVFDARRVAEVVLVNAYKANVLENVLDQRQWEPTTMNVMQEYPYGADEENEDEEQQPQHHDPKEAGDTFHARKVLGDVEDAWKERRRRGSKRTQENASALWWRQRALANSFHRTSVIHASFATQLWRRFLHGAAWPVAHSPPFLMVQGTLYFLRGCLRWAGFVAPNGRRPSALARARMDKGTRLRRLRRGHRRNRTNHRNHLYSQEEQQRQPPAAMSREASSTNSQGSRENSGGDGISTEVCYSDIPPGSGPIALSLHPHSDPSHSSSVTATSSSSSLTDEEGMKDDTVVPAAVPLVSAAVHAVTVQSLQFYYPTAPTVPVFSRPITCTFTLQNEPWLSASPTSSRSPSASTPSSSLSAQRDVQRRGRLVCLVGPSGHGKSTLLSLLLGMYTHYGASGQRSGEIYHEDGVDNPNGETFRSTKAVPSHSLVDTAEGNADEGLNHNNAGNKNDEDKNTVYDGSPQSTTSKDARSSLPADILLTLHMPDTSHRYERHRKGKNNGVSPQSDFSSSNSDAIIEARLPVSAIPRDILRGSLFSFVPQNPVIFSGATIAHNISLENFVSLEQEDLLAEIAQCAAWARCEYIQRFPQGLMTYIADSGTGAWASPLASACAGSGGAGGGGGVVRLSGGQVQRLMLARALFHGRRGGTVLLMDEPTASLDPEVKGGVLAELGELLDKGIVRGIICATHDADLIKVADEVVQLP